MPVTLDKTPAYRVELRKLTALYFVIADTSGQRTPENRIDILSVERAATHDVERRLQRWNTEDACVGAPNLTAVELRAVSAGDAALWTRTNLTDALHEALQVSHISITD